jgi:hypothetical protein
MFTHTAKIAVALTVIAMLGTHANAQRIHPKCAKHNFRDQVGCTCALENGGAVVPRLGGGWRWVSKLGGRQTVNDAFVQCMRRHGRG